MRTAVWSWIEAGDLMLMRRCHAWRAPRWVRLWMVLATRAGDGPLWVALGIALLVFGGEGGPGVVLSASVAAVAGVFLFVLLKRATGRKRPCAIERHCWSNLLPPDRFSFPSGHTLTAYAVCTPVVQSYPELAPLLWFCAGSIAVSRIVLGMHFLSDVLAGASIGYLLGCFVA